MFTHSRVVELLDYNPDTGMFIRKRNAAPADRKHSDNYKAVKVGGKLFLSHRLAWFYMYKVWPEGEIDHINGVRTDNRISNLRVVTRTGNNQNIRTAKRSNKSCGLLGGNSHTSKQQMASTDNGKSKKDSYRPIRHTTRCS